MERVALDKPEQTGGLRPGDQRDAPRVTLLIRPAKLATPEGMFICVIRDVSATGVSVRLFHPVPAGEPALLETETGMQIPMRRMWSRGSEAGFQFLAPIDVSSLINETGGFAKRKLRIGLDLATSLSVAGTRHHASIRNLSQQGALIETDVRLAMAQMVRLHADCLPEIRAQVRWRRGKQYGLVFEDTFALGEFAQIAALLQSPSLLGR